MAARLGYVIEWIGAVLALYVSYGMWNETTTIGSETFHLETWWSSAGAGLLIYGFSVVIRYILSGPGSAIRI